MRTRRPDLQGLLAMLLLASMLAGCRGAAPVGIWAPDDCHGAREPFGTFRLVQTDVPGFKAPIMAAAVTAAMERAGVQHAADDVAADVTLHLSIRLVRRGGAALPTDVRAPTVGEAGASDPQSRFTAHADLELFDERTREVVWKGAMERSHAISGGESFHDDRAEALIEAALDALFTGLTRACE